MRIILMAAVCFALASCGLIQYSDNRSSDNNSQQTTVVSGSGSSGGSGGNVSGDTMTVAVDTIPPITATDPVTGQVTTTTPLTWRIRWTDTLRSSLPNVYYGVEIREPDGLLYESPMLYGDYADYQPSKIGTHKITVYDNTGRRVSVDKSLDY